MPRFGDKRNDPAQNVEAPSSAFDTYMTGSLDATGELLRMSDALLEGGDLVAARVVLEAVDRVVARRAERIKELFPMTTGMFEAARVKS